MRAGGTDPQAAPWVLVAGGFHNRGGMDKANAALATFLLESGHPVHLVTHSADAQYFGQPGVTVHLVSRPANSYLLGEVLLGRRGRQVARRVTREYPGARVVVNGGCCRWPDINWVHYVHRASSCSDRGAPLWFKVKNRLTTAWARRRERAALAAARVVLANSELTRRDLLRHFNLPAERVRTVYLGSDPAWGAVTPAERKAARAWLGKPEERPLVVFVGALGYDNRKGMDTLWSAWQALCARPDWDADLVVAGGGNALGLWSKRIAQSNLEGRVHLLGFTDRVRDLLAAADLLVSPVRYEPYGLNVHEAICRGVPALVSGRAGAAELYPADAAEMIVPDPEDANDLVARLLGWRHRLEGWRERFSAMGAALRERTWERVAEQIVAVASAMCWAYVSTVVTAGVACA